MKESRHFFSSLTLLLLLNILVKPVWIFGIDRHVQNLAGTSAYGSYFSLLNFSIVFSFLLDWGLSGFFNRQLAADQQQFDVLAGKFLFIKFLLILLYAAVVLGTAYLTGVEQWEILIAVIIIQSLTSFFLFLRGIVTARQWFRTDAWLSVLDKGLMIVVCSSFFILPVLKGNMTITIFLWIQVFCTAASVIITLLLLLKKDVLFTIKKGSLSVKVIRQALPFALIVLLMSAHYRLDGFLLERLHSDGAKQAGIYAAAYRLLDAGNMIGYLVASFLLPFVARNSNNVSITASAVNNSRHLLIVFSLATAITVFFFANFIQSILYHSSDPYISAVLQWCLPALIGYSLVQVYGTVMTATGNIVSFSIIVLISLLINIVLNSLLIPSLGAKGCCIAAVISHGLCGIACMLFTAQKTGTGLDVRSLLMYIFIAAALMGYFYVGKRAALNEWLLLSGSFVMILVLTIATGLLSFRKWKLYLLDNK